MAIKCHPFEKCFGSAMGKVDEVLEYAKSLKGKGNIGLWCKGLNKMYCHIELPS